MDRKQRILQKINAAIHGIEPMAEIILFGSRARGDEREDSDWDILILVPYPADLSMEQKFRHKLFEIELEYGQSFSTFVFSKSSWEDEHQITPFYKNIQKEGIRL